MTRMRALLLHLASAILLGPMIAAAGWMIPSAGAAGLVPPRAEWKARWRDECLRRESVHAWLRLVPGILRDAAAMRSLAREAEEKADCGPDTLMTSIALSTLQAQSDQRLNERGASTFRKFDLDQDVARAVDWSDGQLLISEVASRRARVRAYRREEGAINPADPGTWDSPALFVTLATAYGRYFNGVLTRDRPIVDLGPLADGERIEECDIAVTVGPRPAPTSPAAA